MSSVRIATKTSSSPSPDSQSATSAAKASTATRLSARPAKVLTNVVGTVSRTDANHAFPNVKANGAVIIHGTRAARGMVTVVVTVGRNSASSA